MSLPPVRLVCLDLGGVLVRICGGWDEACRMARLQLPPDRVPDAQTVRRLAPISRAHESGKIDDAAFDQQIASAVGLLPEQVAAAANAWLKGAYPGAGDLGRRLSRTPGLWSACLSNTNSRHLRAMTTQGPNYLALEHLNWRFVSYDIGHMKPGPEIFAHVERTAAAEGIDPASIAYFDDNADNVAAGAARGWQAVRIDPDNPDADPPRQVEDELRRRDVAVTPGGDSQ
jgi:FMN phosphatase YigB (HAD superfamily)